MFWTWSVLVVFNLKMSNRLAGDASVAALRECRNMGAKPYISPKLPFHLAPDM